MTLPYPAWVHQHGQPACRCLPLCQALQPAHAVRRNILCGRLVLGNHRDDLGRHTLCHATARRAAMRCSYEQLCVQSDVVVEGGLLGIR